MSLIVISGPAKSGKTVVANSLRDYYLRQGNAVLLLDETNDAEDRDLLAKLLKSAWPDEPPAKPVPKEEPAKVAAKEEPVKAPSANNTQVAAKPPTPDVKPTAPSKPAYIPRDAKTLPWKNKPVIIAVGRQLARLSAFEKIVPGFGQMFCQKDRTFNISTGVGS